MRSTIVLIVSLVIPTLMRAQVPNQEAPVRQAVQAFYDAFNSDGFDSAPNFTSEDWNHISPLGGRTRGRVATVAQVKQVHSTFLKGVSETIEQMDVRFATPEVAVVTVTSHASTFTTPDGVRRENQQQIRTFIVVKRDTRWLIMQDHATYVTAQPAAGR
jgi:uncharacterized protein (TIGR02246 family)